MGGFGGYYNGPIAKAANDTPPVDPLTQPLPCEAPPTWKGRLDRVAWVLEHFTPGEMHELFKIAHDAKGVRYSNVLRVTEKERKALEGTK